MRGFHAIVSKHIHAASFWEKSLSRHRERGKMAGKLLDAGNCLHIRKKRVFKPMSHDPTMHSESGDQVRERRREALLETLTKVLPDEVETKFRDFFGAGSDAWSAWDDQFLDFINRHRGSPLLAGKAGAEFFVVFSPQGRAGFWVFAQPEGGHGKGFLNMRDVERLIAIAAQKGLV